MWICDHTNSSGRGGHSLSLGGTEVKFFNKRFLFSALTILYALQSLSAVTVDTSASNTAADTSSSMTINVTVAAGSNRALVVGIGWRQNVVPTVSGASCSGWTALGSIVINSARTVQWGCTAPATGAQTITVSWNDTFGQDVAGYVISLAGVNQSTPFADYTTATGSSAAPSVTVPNTTADDYVVDSLGHGSGGTTAEGANQFVLYEGDQAVISYAGSRQDGADGGVMSWTEQFADSWAIAAIRVTPAAASSALPLIYQQH